MTLAPVVGYDGRFEHGERTIDDPLELGAKLTAAVNIRATVLDHMASRRRIDTAQKEAGERFARLFRAAAIGRQKAIDYKEAVDGGGAGDDPITESLIQATAELGEAMRVTGMVGSRFLMAIVGEGRSVEEVAKGWTDAGGIVSGERAQGYVTGTFIDALNMLVDHWRLVAVGKPKRVTSLLARPNGTTVKVVDTVLASGPISMTGPQHELTVGRFGDMERVERRPVETKINAPLPTGNEMPGRSRKGGGRAA